MRFWEKRFPWLVFFPSMESDHVRGSSGWRMSSQKFFHSLFTLQSSGSREGNFLTFFYWPGWRWPRGRAEGFFFLLCVFLSWEPWLLTPLTCYKTRVWKQMKGFPCESGSLADRPEFLVLISGEWVMAGKVELRQAERERQQQQFDRWPPRNRFLRLIQNSRTNVQNQDLVGFTLAEVFHCSKMQSFWIIISLTAVFVRGRFKAKGFSVGLNDPQGSLS